MSYEHINDLSMYDDFVVTRASRIPEALVEVREKTSSVLHSVVHVDKVPEFKIEDGACRGLDPNIFYPEKPEIEAKETKAINICNSCSIIDACLENALTKREIYGVRGGTTERGRRNILRRRARL